MLEKPGPWVKVKTCFLFVFNVCALQLQSAGAVKLHKFLVKINLKMEPVLLEKIQIPSDSKNKYIKNHDD